MRSDIPKAELAEKSIKLAQTISDRNKRDACIASAVAFMEKYLTDSERNNILGVLQMTNIFEKVITDEIIKIAKKLIQEKVPIEVIAKSTELDIETIKALQEQEADETDE